MMKIGNPPSTTVRWAGCSLAVLLGACSSAGGLASRNGSFRGGAGDQFVAAGGPLTDRQAHAHPLVLATPSAGLDRADLTAFPARLALGPVFDFGRMSVRETPGGLPDMNAVYSLPGASLALNTEAAVLPRAMKVKAVAHRSSTGQANGPAAEPADAAASANLQE